MSNFIVIWLSGTWGFFGNRFLGRFCFGEDIVPWIFIFIAWSLRLFVTSLILLLYSPLLFLFLLSSLLLFSVINFVIFMHSFLKRLFAKRHFWLFIELFFFSIPAVKSIVKPSGEVVTIYGTILVSHLSHLFGRNFNIKFSRQHFHSSLDKNSLVLDFFQKLIPFFW